jgi:ribonuclease P protein component
MLAAAHRLRRGADFATTIRGGRRAARGALVVHLDLPNYGDLPDDGIEPARPTSRAGFVVSRAVGGAVTRNLVKRRLRHLVAGRLGGLPAGSTLVVRALPAAAVRPYQELGMDLDGALARAMTRRKR